MPEEGIGALTEECFQQTPLEFDGNKQWINYKKDRETGELTEVEALQTRDTVQDKMDKGMTKLPMDSDSGVF